MGNKNLSLTQQNYIETIFELCEEHGHAHSKAIAERLNIRMASVTEGVKGLSTLGLLNYEVRKTITLTTEGLKIARELSRRHLLLSDFFCSLMGYEKNDAEDVACKVEHVIDNKFYNRLSQFMNYYRDSICKDGKDPFKEFKENYSK